MKRTIGRWLVLFGCLGVALPARADTASCTEAHATGQREENAGHLKEALSSFQECASDSACPLPIRNECTSLYTTVEGRLPTLVFSVVDANGNDVVEVQVSSADTQIQSGLDGRPVAVNPGLHEFRLQLPSGEVVSKSVVVRQGEKDRIVAIRLPRGDLGDTPPSEMMTSSATKATPVEPAKGFHVPTAAWISYGVGVAALGSWGAFALLGRNEEKSLLDCSPNCQETQRADYDAMKRNYLIADISLGVAGAAVVAGTVILFTQGRKPRGSEQTAAHKPRRALSFAPAMLGRSGGMLTVEGRY